MNHFNILKRVESALSDLRIGKMIIVTDDANRENEGDIIVAAEFITEQTISFMLQHCSGIICLAVDQCLAKKLDLPLMVQTNSSRFTTGFTISIEAKLGVTTGVSAADRAQTIKVAIQDDAQPEHLARPGHVFPLIARDGGVLVRAGHTEAAVDLMRLAGLKAGGVICELMQPNGTMLRGEQLINFAEHHDIICISIADLIHYRDTTELLVQKQASCDLQLKDHGQFTLSVFQHPLTKEECTVLSKPFESKIPFVRIHSSCFTGDILHSLHCDCGQQLHRSLEIISRHGGLLIYLNQEGRGIGLVNKIKAYALQRNGMDTVEANHQLGFAADERNYSLAHQILKYFSIEKMALLTNNPNKIETLKKFGIDVTSSPLISDPNPFNLNYLKCKQEKLNHTFDI